MKKKKTVWLMIAIIVISVFSVGCKKDQKANLVTPTLKNGVLKWESLKNAESYDVVVGGSTVNVTVPYLDLTENCKTVGEINVQVYALYSLGKRELVGSKNITAINLAKPLVSLKNDSSGNPCYCWYSDKNASGYEYDLFDGNGFVEAKPDKDNTFNVPVNTSADQRITVRAKGSSKKTVLYTDNESSLNYSSNNIFNLSRLANYPFVFNGDGNTTKFPVATTLKKGTYKLDVTLFLMTSEGSKLTGNGTWGRRITDNNIDHWFCESEVENHPGSGNTIPDPGTPINQTFDISVNRFGEVVFDKIYNFKEGEMLVFADICLNGKSVIAKKPIDHSNDEVHSLNISNLNSIATYKGAGIYYSEGTPDQFEVDIPVSWDDGVYRVNVGYYGVKTDGSALEGNGIFARAISDETRKENSYLCEYDIPEAKITGIELYKAETKYNSEYSVKVKNGKFKLVCTGFRKNEIVIFTDAKKIGGSNKQFKNKKSYKYIFESKGPTDYEPEQFIVDTDRTKRETLNVDVTYYVMDKDGWMLTGNGFWGRRICDESGNKYWACYSKVRDDYPESANTIPESVTPITKTMKVTVNKKGRFVLEMYDFSPGETVVIADVKTNGKSILE